MQSVFVALMVVASTCAQTAPSPKAQLESLERRIGPFALSGQKFTVALQVKRLQSAGKVDPDFGETVAAMEIRDEAGKIHHRATFPYKITGDRFSDTMSVHAEMLGGTKGQGLLITYGFLPSTPLGGQSWQVFGVSGGALTPFSKTLSTYGELITQPPGKALRTSWDPALKADLLKFRVWTGNFFVILPLRVDWLRGRVAPAYRCWKLTPSGPKPRCRLDVEAERRPSDDLTFVRLFPNADESGGIAAHAVVKKDSTVEFLSAEAEVRWDETADGINLGVSEDVWLKVRVDGKEGWIHTQEDFLAIGLPLAG